MYFSEITFISVHPCLPNSDSIVFNLNGKGIDNLLARSAQVSFRNTSIHWELIRGYLQINHLTQSLMRSEYVSFKVFFLFPSQADRKIQLSVFCLRLI